LLFIFALFDIDSILKEFPSIKLLIYADDILIISENLQDIQRFLNRLIRYLTERNLKLNAEKSKILKFRKKGRGSYKLDDILRIGDDEIEFVTDFIYLGIKFQASGTSFTKHIAKRTKAAIFATSQLHSLPKASLDTALKLFDLAIAPVASYGIEAIWSYLKLNDLQYLETVKSRFLKKAMGLSKVNKARYTYELADTSTFIEDLRWRFSLPETESYNKFLTNWAFKLAEIDPKFYETPAMVDQNWKNSCFENRHVFTRYACHGYHYVLCKNQKFHLCVKSKCKCKKCGQQMDNYHFLECKENNMSLVEASKWKKA
jgi:hypothetical protein